MYIIRSIVGPVLESTGRRWSMHLPPFLLSQRVFRAVLSNHTSELGRPLHCRPVRSSALRAYVAERQSELASRLHRSLTEEGLQVTIQIWCKRQRIRRKQFRMKFRLLDAGSERLLACLIHCLAIVASTYKHVVQWKHGD